jgi:hypothetical protein
MMLLSFPTTPKLWISRWPEIWNAGREPENLLMETSNAYRHMCISTHMFWCSCIIKSSIADNSGILKSVLKHTSKVMALRKFLSSGFSV